MRSLQTVALIAFVAVSVAGCRRNSGPSPEYAEASGAYDRLRVEKGDDAYSDPEMTRVEQLLGKVHEQSTDSAAAKEMLAKIAAERKRIADEAAALAAAPTEAAPSEPQFPEETEETEYAQVEESTGADAGVDAGYAQPAQGMTTSEFESKFGRCFERGDDLLVNGLGMRGTYQMKDLSSCRDRHPDYRGLLLLIENGKIGGFAQQSAVEMRLPDGGTPRENPEGTPAPEGEGTQQQPSGDQSGTGSDSIKY